MKVELKFRAGFPERLDVSTLQPELLLKLTKIELEHLMLLIGNRMVNLTELCSVRWYPTGIDELVFSGETHKLNRIGYSMQGGRLVVEGDAGDEVGVAIVSGLITVRGSVGDLCGANEFGKTPGMRGGMILVEGNAGSQTGASMRRGLIYVSRNSGNYAGARMTAGTILCGGRLGNHPGLGMKRGSIVATRIEGLLPGFFLAGKADDEWLRVCLSGVRKAGMDLPAKWLKKIPQRFTGDHLEMGKGEILVYDKME